MGGTQCKEFVNMILPLNLWLIKLLQKVASLHANVVNTNSKSID